MFVCTDEKMERGKSESKAKSISSCPPTPRYTCPPTPGYTCPPTPGYTCPPTPGTCPTTPGPTSPTPTGTKLIFQTNDQKSSFW